MALHIADPEVTRLMNEYVKVTGLSKTESLRRLLRQALQEQRRNKNKTAFADAARRITEKNRALNLAAVTKQEADSIFE
jgi:hypothetical protein